MSPGVSREFNYRVSFMRSWAILVIAWAVATTSASGPSPTVETAYGRVKGFNVKSFGGREFAAFTGIPYAKPPVGQLRFQPPQKPDKFSGVFDATKDGSDCIQPNHFYNQYPIEWIGKEKIVGSEDCLFLNIYTPDVKPTSPLPVMVFIHGGGYIVGSGANVLQGPEILLDRDIILVTINYRLDALGFLKLDDEVLPGNYGLKDQSMALSWIQENIKAFGGDPKSVTLFGESAGGASVHLQMLSPLSRGLFHRGISQSGTAYNVWAMSRKEEAREAAEKLVEAVNCKSADAAAVLECLNKVPTLEIVKASASIKAFPLEIIFKPVLENEKKGSFITHKSLKEGSKLPWISGANTAEGLIMYGESVQMGDKDLSKFKAAHKEFLPKMFSYAHRKNKDEMTEKIVKTYFGDKDIGLNSVNEFVNLFTDGFFYHGLNEAASRHKGPLYQYLLSYQGERSFSDFDGLTSLNIGVNHCDDLIYLLNMKKFYPDLKFNEKDAAISNLMVDMWTEFAKNGNPTPEGSSNPWPQSVNRGETYVDISGVNLTLKKDLHQTRSKFWRELFKSKVKHEEL